MRDLVHWLFAWLPAPSRRARFCAIVGAGVAILSAGTPSPATAACAGSEILSFMTRPGYVGWTVRIDKGPKCAFPSLVVVMDLIDASQTVHKFNFTLQYNSKTRQPVKVLGIDDTFPNLYYGPDPNGTRFVLAYHYILGTQVSGTMAQVKMFASFAGRACRYEGPAFGPQTLMGPDPIIADCSPRRPGDHRRPPSR